MARKNPIVVDNNQKPVKCYTVRQVAKLLGMTLADLKLVMYKHKDIAFYKLMGLTQKRKVIRITDEDLQKFSEAQDMFDTIGDRIKQARAEFMVLKPMTQEELAKDVNMTFDYISRLERKSQRINLRMLKKIADATGKKIEWFLS
jgi:transcriptional regulator with XRE-family HTH domain